MMRDKTIKKESIGQATDDAYMNQQPVYFLQTPTNSLNWQGAMREMKRNKEEKRLLAKLLKRDGVEIIYNI